MKKRCLPYTVISTCFLYCICVHWAAGQDAKSGVDTFASILKSETYGLSDESIEEIVRVRQQLGGGTCLDEGGLAGRLLTDQHQVWEWPPIQPGGLAGQGFTAHDPSEVAPKSNEISQLRSVLDCDPVDPMTSPNWSEQLFFEMIHSGAAATTEWTSERICLDESNHISALRSVARRIDELAADLEEINQFEHADGLRIQASSLRGSARNSHRSADSNRRLVR